MLSSEENELLTRTGRGTPMGSLVRRYWIPALFSNQLPEPDGPPIRVKLLGENLVAFRNSEGRVGILDERCPHRTASLYFGRNEECGLRCVYHGWKFDIEGNCVDMPSEPAGNNFMHKIRIAAYPCIERGGLVWTFMGPAEAKPEFPDLEWTQVPDSHRYVTRHIQECNWLQALEGGFDSAHLSFLHRGTADVLHNQPFPVPTKYEAIEREFGIISATGRDVDGGSSWAANLMLMPFHKLISTSPIGAHAWVPIDDEHTMNYSVEYRPDRPLDEQDLAMSRSGDFIHPQLVPGEHKVQNRNNDYLIDRSLQRISSFTGIRGLGVQDCAIQESMGPVANRTIEHLGVSDTVIIKLRRFLLKALRDLQQGHPLIGVDPAAYQVRSGFFKVAPGGSFEAALDDCIRIPPPTPSAKRTSQSY